MTSGSVQQPIGVFDSGVGGLSVLRHIIDQLPHEKIIYVADQAHVPYGQKSAENIRTYTRQIIQYFLEQNAKLICVACNTASAAALTYVRALYPTVPIVGMEPAVKPGAKATKTGMVGVLATAGTFHSQRYTSLMERYAQDVVLFENPCLGLVDLIEDGAVDSPETEALLKAVVTPMLAADVDTLVLGCTHYPFIRPLLENIAGDAVTIIDPAPAVARQVRRLLEKNDILTQLNAIPPLPERLTLLTTGNAEAFGAQVSQLLKRALPVAHLSLDATHA